MKTIRTLLATTALFIAGLSASATTIDATSPWIGAINSGWNGSAQSLTVDSVENTLNTFSAYFADAAVGQTFDFVVSDSFDGGATLFATSFVVSSGLNTITVNQSFAPSSTIYALFDYNGYTGQSVHYNSNVYAGGVAAFTFGSDYFAFSEFDLRFKAEFSGGGQRVPDSAGTLPLLALAIAGLIGLRRK